MMLHTQEGDIVRAADSTLSYKGKNYETAFLLLLFYFFKDFISLFLERGEGREKRGKHQCVVSSHMPPTGHLAYNPGMCPD